MNHFRPGLRPLFCAALLVTLSMGARLRAQALPTASKTNSISAFGGYTYSNPEYGSYYDQGVTFGANFVQHLSRIPLDPSFEARVNLTSGTDVNERTYLFGLRAQAHGYFHVHPYGDFLVGPGNIKFNLSNGSSYTTDNSTVYNYGAGVDIDTFRQFQLKLDFQRQHWALGQPSVPFQPIIGLVGITYRFHFRDYNKQGEAR
jgi:hypothetical protein